jgi:phage gp16-like protein
MKTQHPTDERIRLYRLMEVGRRELRMDEFSFRMLLARHGAKEKDSKVSRQTMSLEQLQAAIAEMKQKGFKPRQKGGAKVTPMREARVAKLRAMWIALAEAGVVRDRSDAALTKFCARITKNARMEWLTTHQLNDCVNALRIWASREGVLVE